MPPHPRPASAAAYERRLRLKRALRLWGPLVVAWTVTCIVLSRVAGLRTIESFAWFDLLGGLIMGLAFGTAMAWSETRGLGSGRWQAPPWVDLVARTALYTVVMAAAILVVRAVLYRYFPEQTSRGYARPLLELWADRRVQRFAALLFAATFALNFVLHLRLAVGPQHLAALFTGRYRRPVFERRAFVFVDLADSTPTAEALGPLAFTRFKHDFFSDIAEPLLFTGGHIVQYVGDEVMLTWREDELGDGRAPLRFVRALERRLRRRAPVYEERYGTRPRFRTGIHYGEVVVAQVGDTRRDIVYSGDVVNASARLLQSCRPVGVDGLISAVAARRLDALSTRPLPSVPAPAPAPGGTEVSLSLHPVGPLSLRGRSTAMEAYGWRWDEAGGEARLHSRGPRQ